MSERPVRRSDCAVLYRFRKRSGSDLSGGKEYTWKAGMVDSKHLRQIGEQLLAVALNTEDQELLSDLTVRACEYLDQASVLEAPMSPVTKAPTEPFSK
jgi:hypothetical protein